MHYGAVELRQLEYVVAVAEHLHFGRAAAALSIGQPAVSQQIARLERELGVALFDRSGRTVRLTAAGERFVPEARAALAGVARAKEAAGGAHRALLRVGTSTGLGDRLTLALAALRASRPDLGVELVSAATRARLERVAGGQLDAAFVRGTDSAPGVELIELWRDELVVALPARHALTRSAAVPIGALADLPLRLVARTRNPPLVDVVVQACAAAGFTPTRGTDPGSLDSLLAAIAAAEPSWTVIYAAQARTIRPPGVVFRPTVPALELPTRLAVAAGARSRDLAALLDACARIVESAGQPILPA